MWEGFSEPLDCPSDERCSPESMRGTLALWGKSDEIIVILLDC